MHDTIAQPADHPREHPLFESVDELLSPAALSLLTGRDITGVRLMPFSSVDGRSGGHLQAVEVDAAGERPGASRYVLKRFSWDQDVTMRISGDRAGRAVVIWQKGLLDRLPPQIAHGVAGAARDGDGWALLLQDFGGFLLPPHEQRITDQEDTIVLDAIAAMHDAFWQEPVSSIEEYSLCSLHARYGGRTPREIRGIGGQNLPIIPYILDGWELLREVVDRDIAQLIEALHADPEPLCAALSRYSQTLIHGDCHPGNLGIIPGPLPRTILLDWTFGGLGPPAADLAEYIFIGIRRLPSSKEATIERYRELLSRRLGDRFDEDWWVPQLELALLGEFLRLGFDKLQVAVNGQSEAIRAREREEIEWWCTQIRRATRWL